MMTQDGIDPPHLLGSLLQMDQLSDPFVSNYPVFAVDQFRPENLSAANTG